MPSDARSRSESRRSYSDQLGQPRDAVFDLRLARQGIAEAQGVATAAVVEERAAGDEGDACLLHRTVEQAGGVDAGAQLHPDEKAAIRACPAHALGHVALQRRQHGIATAPVVRSGTPDLSV